MRIRQTIQPHQHQTIKVRQLIEQVFYIIWHLLFHQHLYLMCLCNPDKPLFITLWDGFGLLCYLSGIWIMLFTFLVRIDYVFKSLNHASLQYPRRLIIYLYVHCILIGISMGLIVITSAASAQIALSVVA
eukprot:467687_1